MTTTRKYKDANQLAKSILDQATGNSKEPKTSPAKPAKGVLGGRARASKLTSEQKIDAARLAATVRWKKTD
jgi:hypothetical protein